MPLGTYAKVIKVDSSIYLELEREATTILFCEARPSKSTGRGLSINDVTILVVGEGVTKYGYINDILE